LFISDWLIRPHFNRRFVWNCSAVLLSSCKLKEKATDRLNSNTLVQFSGWFWTTLCGRMDDSTKLLLQRLVRRIPTKMLKATLEKWGRLSAAQRQALDFTQSKWALTETLFAICEVCDALFSLLDDI